MGSKKHKKHKSERRERHDAEVSSPVATQQFQGGVTGIPLMESSAQLPVMTAALSPVPPQQFSSSMDVKPPSLKLILKVGGSSTPERTASPCPPVSVPSTLAEPPRERHDSSSRHKKSKKKKKKKERSGSGGKSHKRRKRDRDESSQDDISGADEEPPKKVVVVPEVVVKQEVAAIVPPVRIVSSPQGSPHREPRTCVLRQQRSPFQRLLDHLLRALEKKDHQQFFAWPVTDNIAPGYSQIITRPMDLSSMRHKSEAGEYATLRDFTEDLRLMCDNAMTYNHAETIYYKAAAKLLHFGLRLVSADKLRQLYQSMLWMGTIAREELGFDLGVVSQVKVEEEEVVTTAEEAEEDVPVEVPPVPKSAIARIPASKFQAIPDDLTPEQILAQARGAAKAAAEKLGPKNQLGFLRQRPDGTTSLAVLHPMPTGGDGEIVERPVPLGQLVGRLTHGSGQLQGFREDRRNLAKPVKPLYYGAFGSHAPAYDSTFSNLSKEESDLVLATYGDEGGVQYADSIVGFAKDCDYAMQVVDELLNILSGGEHCRVVRYLDERRRIQQEDQAGAIASTSNATTTSSTSTSASASASASASTSASTSSAGIVNVQSLRSLSELGIDTSFLDAYERSTKEEEAIQSKLEETSGLLEQLEKVQRERLSLGPSGHHLTGLQPSEGEVQLAERITSRLAEMAREAQPHHIAPLPSIRKAMGVVDAPIVESESPKAVPTSPESPHASPPKSPVQAEEVEDTKAEEPMEVEEKVEEVKEDGKVPSPVPEVPEVVDLQPTAPPSSSPPPPTLPATASVTPAVPPTPLEAADLESELREFLENNEPALDNSPIDDDDKTLEEMLSA